MNSKSVADVAGPWVDSLLESSLIERCKEYWNVPVNRLPNSMLATFIRQRVAPEIILPEAYERLNSGFDDNSEMFDGELADSIKEYEETNS